MEWDWREVDGVTTLSAPAGAIQGPLQAGLMFGVGRVDETMTVAGITHAVEHLAFQPLGHRPYGLNGSVSSVCTRFVVVGGPDDVVEFLRAITRNLSELPLDGLEHELEVLRVEEQQRRGRRSGTTCPSDSVPTAPDSSDGPNTGSSGSGPTTSARGPHTWFTAGNAALWTSGPLPARLDLSALPLGDAPTAAAWRPSLPPPRSFAVAQTNLVSVSAIADPVTGIVPALEVAERARVRPPPSSRRAQLRHRDRERRGSTRITCSSTSAPTVPTATTRRSSKVSSKCGTSSPRAGRPRPSGTT